MGGKKGKKKGKKGKKKEVIIKLGARA